MSVEPSVGPSAQRMDHCMPRWWTLRLASGPWTCRIFHSAQGSEARSSDPPWSTAAGTACRLNSGADPGQMSGEPTSDVEPPSPIEGPNGAGPRDALKVKAPPTRRLGRCLLWSSPAEPQPKAEAVGQARPAPQERVRRFSRHLHGKRIGRRRASSPTLVGPRAADSLRAWLSAMRASTTSASAKSVRYRRFHWTGRPEARGGRARDGAASIGRSARPPFRTGPPSATHVGRGRRLKMPR